MTSPALPNVQKTLTVDGQSYVYYSVRAAETHNEALKKLPFSLKVLLENLLRHQKGRSVKFDDIQALGDWTQRCTSNHEIAFHPARVLMQDFTGVPAVVDLAAMRDAMTVLGGDPLKINPLTPVDLVIDHSVMVDAAGTDQSFEENVALEYARNQERYRFLRWGQDAFENFRVVPPGTGICHQVNLEYLSQVVWTREHDGEQVAYPDTLVGTDSHTTMVNGLAVLGWGVGGIEAEAAMLGQPLSMIIPEVIGFKLTGKLREGATATDLVLTVTQMLRTFGVVNKFVEFYGTGLSSMKVADRATLANMAPEYGATCGFFPIDAETIRYLELTHRDAHRIKLVEAYAREQGMWRDEDTPDPLFTATLELNLAEVESSLAGPKRPQDRVLLSQAPASIAQALSDDQVDVSQKAPVVLTDSAGSGVSFDIEHGHVVIAAITSCTNTSNPSVMIGAGLMAKKAWDKGLRVKPWVKTSLAPGSQVVTDYLIKAGVQPFLDHLGFNLVGYGCTTCIGNSGPLHPSLSQAIEEQKMSVVSVLSGNRNFEGRIHPLVKHSYLASPLLVVAYALAGSLKVDLYQDALGHDQAGQPVYLKDIWPTDQEIHDLVSRCITPQLFQERYSKVFEGDSLWQRLEGQKGKTYQWDANSTYVKKPPYFEGLTRTLTPAVTLRGARLLAVLGDSITTDHISPAGSIKSTGPAGLYLQDHDINVVDFNSYGARRGNHEVMMRGTFANIRLKNEMVPETTGGVTRHYPSQEVLSIFEASMRYQEEGVPLVIIAGREYGTGSSRDWAAKGTGLLGVKAVIAESFERIHRSNLVGMGILPLEFTQGMNRQALRLTGEERFDLEGFDAAITPHMTLNGIFHRADGSSQTVELKCRIDTLEEIDYFKNGGILQYVLRSMNRVA